MHRIDQAFEKMSERKKHKKATRAKSLRDFQWAEVREQKPECKLHVNVRLKALVS